MQDRFAVNFGTLSTYKVAPAICPFYCTTDALSIAHLLSKYLAHSASLVLARRCPHTVCPRSSDPFYIVIYFIKRVTTSWTDSTYAGCPSLSFEFSLIVVTNFQGCIKNKVFQCPHFILTRAHALYNGLRYKSSNFDFFKARDNIYS